MQIINGEQVFEKSDYAEIIEHLRTVYEHKTPFVVITEVSRSGETFWRRYFLIRNGWLDNITPEIAYLKHKKLDEKHDRAMKTTNYRFEDWYYFIEMLWNKYPDLFENKKEKQNIQQCVNYAQEF